MVSSFTFWCWPSMYSDYITSCITGVTKYHTLSCSHVAFECKRISFFSLIVCAWKNNLDVSSLSKVK
jgi:hypothetical protein